MMAEYGHRSFGSMFTIISWMAGKGFPETIAVSVLGGGSRSGSFRHVMGPEPRRVIPLVAWAPTTRPRRTSAAGPQRANEEGDHPVPEALHRARCLIGAGAPAGHATSRRYSLTTYRSITPCLVEDRLLHFYGSRDVLRVRFYPCQSAAKRTISRVVGRGLLRPSPAPGLRGRIRQPAPGSATAGSSGVGG